MSCNYIGDSGRSHEMIEAIAVIGNEEKIPTTVLENV
jgi:hypothetical protein